jgi:hypothetical protein
MADAVHVEGVEPDLLCHSAAPFQQLENGGLHSNEEQSHASQSDTTAKDSAHGWHFLDSALQAKPAAEKERAGKKEPNPLVDGAHGWRNLRDREGSPSEAEGGRNHEGDPRRQMVPLVCQRAGST